MDTSLRDLQHSCDTVAPVSNSFLAEFELEPERLSLHVSLNAITENIKTKRYVFTR